MAKKHFREFQNRFREWLGPDPENAVRVVAKKTGYSVDYLRWVAGLIGNKPWPGSYRLVRTIERLGCTDRPWRDRPPSELRYAFENREELR